jgi:hypothetical protein
MDFQWDGYQGVTEFLNGMMYHKIWNSKQKIHDKVKAVG